MKTFTNMKYMCQMTANTGRAPIWVPILEIQFVAIAVFKQTLACLMWRFPSLLHPQRFFGNARVASVQPSQALVLYIHKCRPVTQLPPSGVLLSSSERKGHWWHISHRNCLIAQHRRGKRWPAFKDRLASTQPQHCQHPLSLHRIFVLYINLWVMFPQQAVDNNLSTIRLLYKSSSTAVLTPSC